MNYLAISDIEGRDINKLLLTPDYIQEPHPEVIICGDVLDSTFFPKNPVDQLDHRYPERKFNLHNLVTICTNENIHLICGNRDIDKIKILLLGKLKNQEIPLIASFNDGSIDITQHQYEAFRDLLSVSTDSKWEIDFNHWMDKLDITETEELSTIFFRRFKDVLGTSAPNILYTIPLELQITSSLEGNALKDYYAFIVLVVYNSLLRQETPQIPYDISMFDTPFTNCKAFAGLLYNVYLKIKLTKYIDYGNTDYFFSHGGITQTFYKDPTILYRYWDFILSYNKDVRKKPLTEKYIGSTPQEFEAYCNRFITSIIANIYDDITKSKNDIKLLLTLCFPINCKNDLPSNIKKCDFLYTKDDGTVVTVNNPFKDIKTGTGIVPILPGFRDIITDHIPNDNGMVKRFNVFGHQPVGFSPMIKALDNNSVVLIDLDTSNSFLNTMSNVSSLSYLYISNDTNTHIVSSIEFSDLIVMKKYSHIIEPTDNFTHKYLEMSSYIYSASTILVCSEQILGRKFKLFNTNLNSDNEPLFHIMNAIDNKLQIKTPNKNLVFFHGIIQQDLPSTDTTKYCAFTITETLKDFTQIFFILNKHDLQDFFDVQIYDESNRLIDFENKYLKYKIKYINLKMILN